MRKSDEITDCGCEYRGGDLYSDCTRVPQMVVMRQRQVQEKVNVFFRKTLRPWKVDENISADSLHKTMENLI